MSSESPDQNLLRGKISCLNISYPVYQRGSVI